ncbi:arylalkylamine N-acetyltransferase-like 2 [Musca autumnalis]|uniref:arylalkylamine N-acetyltransferase-like 2 n=1 Tax=Musca autumnalis TaxID=221902 RepID=UPI003CF50814
MNNNYDHRLINLLVYAMTIESKSNKSINVPTIQIEIIKSNDCDKVITFLRENFFPQAPLASCEPKWIPSAEDEADLRKCIIHYGCSIMAMENDELVGVCIALPKKRSSIDEYYKEAEKAGKTKHGYIMKLLGDTNSKADIFNRYGVEEILYLFLASVAANQRGRNIAGLMTRELMRLGKSMNYEVLSMDCSSYYCAQVCERLGMDCLNSTLYAEYLDEMGEVMFKPKPPHVAMKTYAQRL